MDRIARMDKLIEASKRAARIVDRVLPLNRTGRSALTETAGFIVNAVRHGERRKLYAAILPRMNAKVLGEPARAEVRRAA